MTDDQKCAICLGYGNTVDGTECQFCEGRGTTDEPPSFWRDEYHVKVRESHERWRKAVRGNVAARRVLVDVILERMLKDIQEYVDDSGKGAACYWIDVIAFVVQILIEERRRLYGPEE